MINFTSSFINCYTNDKAGEERFKADLKEISTSKNLMVQKDGRIVNADKTSVSLFDRFKGALGLGTQNTDNQLLENGVSELLKFGAQRNWIDAEDKQAISKIAHRFGLFPDTTENHEALHNVVSGISRDVFHSDVFPENAILDEWGDENAIRHLRNELLRYAEEPDLIELYTKRLLHENGLQDNNHQIAEILAASGTTGTDWVLKNENHDAFLARQDFKTAYTILTGGYQLSLLLKADELALLKEGEPTNFLEVYQHSADAFKKRLIELIDNHPEEFREITKTSDDYEPEQISQEELLEKPQEKRKKDKEKEKELELPTSPPVYEGYIPAAPPPPVKKVGEEAWISNEEARLQRNFDARIDLSLYREVPASRIEAEKRVKEKIQDIEEMIEVYEGWIADAPAKSKELGLKLQAKIEARDALLKQAKDMVEPLPANLEMAKFKEFTNEEIAIILGLSFEDYDFASNKIGLTQNTVIKLQNLVHNYRTERLSEEKIDAILPNKSAWFQFFKEGQPRINKLLKLIDDRAAGKEIEPTYAPRPHDPTAKPTKKVESAVTAGDVAKEMMAKKDSILRRSEAGEKLRGKIPTEDTSKSKETP